MIKNRDRIDVLNCFHFKCYFLSGGDDVGPRIQETRRGERYLQA